MSATGVHINAYVALTSFTDVAPDSFPVPSPAQGENLIWLTNEKDDRHAGELKAAMKRHLCRPRGHSATQERESSEGRKSFRPNRP